MKNEAGFLNKEISVVTLITSVSYFITYLFQLGQASYFSYPSDFIVTDLTVVIRTVGFVLFILFCFGHMLELFFRIKKANFIQFLITTIMASFFINAYLFGISSSFGVFKGEGESEQVVVFFFVLLFGVFVSKIKKIRQVGYLSSELSDYAILAGCMAGTAYLAGVINVFSINNLYVTDDAYVMLGSYGDNIVLGKCTPEQRFFKRINIDDKFIFHKVGKSGTEDIKSCFKNGFLFNAKK